MGSPLEDLPQTPLFLPASVLNHALVYSSSADVVSGVDAKMHAHRVLSSRALAVSSGPLHGDGPVRWGPHAGEMFSVSLQPGRSVERCTR